MATPKAVEAQDAKADEMLDLFDEGEQEGAPDGDTLEPQTEDQTPVEAAPEPVTPAPEPVATDDAANLKKQLDYEKHRNDSLQGRLDSQLRPLNDTVRELRTHIAELEAKLTRRVTDERNAVPAHLRHMRPDEVESMGKEAIEAQSRIARGVAEDLVLTREEEIATRQRATDERIAALEEQKQTLAVAGFWDKVEKAVPGSREINESDSRWYTFLDTVDQYSGRPRRDIGQAAMSLGDVKRVADLVHEFKEWAGEAAPRPVAPAVQRPEAVKATPAAARPATSNSAPVIRQSQVKKFYDDWARGKFGNDEKRALQIEAAIDKALDEGRVVDG